MKRLALLLPLLLSACGAGTPHDDDVVVRRYEAANGDVAGSAEFLGFTYYTPKKGAKHGKAGFNSLIWDGLTDDADGDKIVRVVMHELEQVLLLRDGNLQSPDYPPAFASDWYANSGDSKDPLALVPPDEAAWLATHGMIHVSVGDVWLEQPTDDAITRLDDAAGVVVFTR